jgi:formylglycine-generating enzyme required for sulfatase activity
MSSEQRNATYPGRRFGLLCRLGVLLLALAAPTVAPAQQGSDRIALVIGNANYPDARTPLPNAIRDATSVAEEFRRLNYSVDAKRNLRKDEMQKAIDDFTGKIKKGATAVFYFSGYGLQVARQSYLLPVNAQVWTEADVRRDGVSLDALLTEMSRKGADVKIVIVDAARRNPFERRFRASPAGLAPLEAPAGTLIMCSAAPGKLIEDKPATGNSVFAGELLKELRAPNLTAEEVFNRTRIGVSRASSGEQVPWVASSLLTEVYFGAKRASPPPAPPRSSSTTPFPPAPTKPPAAREEAPQSEPRRADLPPPRTSAPVSLKPGEKFRDCAECPEMIVLAAGAFEMGATKDHERPVHQVTIPKPFAVGLHEVTFEQWDTCVSDGGCKFKPADRGWGRGNRPVINVSWLDAKEYVTWLSQKTGQTYRLPTEAEWEYAARGGSSTPFWWGRTAGSRQANCRECSTGQSEQTMPVGSYKPNPFGVFDTAGNAAEWVEDCWNDGYRGAPTDGSAWLKGECRLRVLRGGSFDSQSDYVRSNSRFRYDIDVRYSANGFRVVRELR